MQDLPYDGAAPLVYEPAGSQLDPFSAQIADEVLKHPGERAPHPDAAVPAHDVPRAQDYGFMPFDSSGNNGFTIYG